MTRPDCGLRLTRAFDFLALLIGREWVTSREIREALGCHRRTVIRYIEGAEVAGLVEVERGRARGPYEPTRVRLVNVRMRRAA